MKLNPAVTDLFAFRYEDFTLEGYGAYPHIAGQGFHLKTPGSSSR